MHFKPNMHSDGYLSYSNTQRKPRLPDISESSRGHAEVPPLASNSQASSADGNPIDISWWILDTPANMEQTELAALWSRLKNTESHSMIDLPSKVYANLRYGGVQRSRVYHRSPQKHRRFGAAHFGQLMGDLGDLPQKNSIEEEQLGCWHLPNKIGRTWGSSLRTNTSVKSGYLTVGQPLHWCLTDLWIEHGLM